MTVRTTLTDAARKARMGTARATIREVSDGHLMQEVKYADVYHSETPSDFERWQMVGMTAVPIKQQQSTDQPQKAQSPPGAGDWNHDQPQGPAAEAVMLYLNGSRSHPVALVDDRRVRPYNMNEGEGAHYAPDGSEQMTFFNKSGAYLVSLDGKSVAEFDSNNTRMASLRHVNKSMQTHKIEEGQQQQPYKHEGESVNTEVRCTAGKVEVLDGNTVIAVYDKGAKSWTFSNCQSLAINVSDTVSIDAKNINLTASATFNINGKPINFNGGGPVSPPFTVPG